MVVAKKIVFTPQDIIDSYGSPQLVLDAPAAGIARNVLGITHRKSYNSAPYTGGTVMEYKAQGASDTFAFDDQILASTDNNYKVTDRVRYGSLALTAAGGLYMKTDALCADGDSDIEAVIVYEDVLMEDEDSSS